jgi:hypothetical protein
VNGYWETGFKGFWFQGTRFEGSMRMCRASAQARAVDAPVSARAVVTLQGVECKGVCGGWPRVLRTPPKISKRQG